VLGADIGVFVERYLRTLTLIGTTLFALSTLVMGIMSDFPGAIYTAVAVWG
jgi:hypothetical protein